MTVFFTRVKLNPRRRGTARLLDSPQQMHAAIASSFPPDVAQTTDEGRVLWRVDRVEHDVTLYVVSPNRPDLTHLVEQAGWPTTTVWETKTYDGFLARLQRGQVWTFRLLGNPVHYGEADAGEVKRFGHQTDAQMTDWFSRKGTQNGFSLVGGGDDLPGVRISDVANRSFNRGGQRQRVSLRTARFDGTLEVTDADALRRALTHGVGAAKGYGCGLLTLARPVVSG